MNQQEQINLTWLLNRGWTISQASDELGVSRSHLWRVIRNERESARLIERIRQLPQRGEIRWRTPKKTLTPNLA